MAEEKRRPELKIAFQEVLKVLRTPPEVTPEFQNMEIEEVIERLEEALRTLDTEMERIYKNTGMTREQMEEFAQNPDNFSRDEWKLLGEVRQELDIFQKEAESLLGPTAMEVPAGEHEVVEKPKKRGLKGKKGWKRA